MFILMINGESAVPFTKVKQYELGTGYVALCKENEGCILCRYLNDYEKEMFDKLHFLYDCSNEPLTNASANKIGRPVIIITDTAENFDKTDKIIEDLKSKSLGIYDY